MTIITLEKEKVSTNDLLDHFKMTDDEIKGISEEKTM
jgi:hypothetical protein